MVYINKVSIKNYKSIIDLTIELENGFNIISGKNNTGKTAFLEALSLDFKSNPHKLRENPSDAHSIENSSMIELHLETTKDDLYRYFLEHKLLVLPFAMGGAPYHTKANPLHSSNGKFVTDEINKIFSSVTEFSSTIVKESPKADIKDIKNRMFLWSKKSFGYEYPNSYGVFAGFSNVISDEIKFRQEFKQIEFQEWQAKLFNFLSADIFYIRANRNINEFSLISENEIFNSDASNLASILHYQCINNHDIFQEISSYFRFIFPEVKSLGFDIVAINNQPFVELQLWYENSSTRLKERAVPLHKCGTGASHILAILCGVMIARTPKTFIIDEPQSFLHPGAIRTLFGILKSYNKTLQKPHQFIVATHSPFLVSASDNQSVLIMHRNHWESKIEKINPSDNEELKFFLLEIGVRLSDVFGVDNVLWVEGITEEYCFREILLNLSGISLFGTKILPLFTTGDLEQKDRTSVERIISIYERLTNSGGLIPPTVCFVLDREGRTEAEINEMIRRSANKIKFIDVRLYENYILDSEAIFLVLKDISEKHQFELSIDQTKIEELLKTKLNSPKYYEKNIVPLTDSEKLKGVHGANILTDIFKEVSENTVEYRKIPYSKDITNKLIHLRSEKLTELRLFLEQLLSARD